MAKTTFSGPVRSENNYKVVSKTASTGVVHDRTLLDGVKDARRYYLEEWFNQTPGVNGDLASATEGTRVPANRDFEILGTNHTSALCTYSSTVAGLTITTAGTDDDQMIIAPHLDTGQTAWTGTKWGTENQVQWEALIRTAASIADIKFWAGLNETTANTVADRDDKAFFKFQTDATNGEAFSDFTLLHFVHSIAGTDYISALPITVAASTNYHLKIAIDSDRKATIYVNGIQYNVTSTAGSTGGTAVTAVQPSKSPTKSAALTDDKDLIPYIGVATGVGSAKALDVHYEGISRLIFE